MHEISKRWLSVISVPNRPNITGYIHTTNCLQGRAAAFKLFPIMHG